MGLANVQTVIGKAGAAARQAGGVSVGYELDPMRGQRSTLYVDMTAVFRPFESKYYQTTRGRPQREEKPDDEAVFILEAQARTQVTTLEGLGWTYDWSESEEPDVEEDEVTRVTETERVFNPNDPEQYVDVEIVRSITLRNKANRLVKMNLTND